MSAADGKRSRVASHLAPALLAAVCLFAVWAVSPALVDRAEPWDADWPYYSTCSLILGFGVGLAFRRHLLSTYMGAWGGQVLALLCLPGHDRAWWHLGVITTAFGSLIFLIGVAVGSSIATFARRPARRSS